MKKIEHTESVTNKSEEILKQIPQKIMKQYCTILSEEALEALKSDSEIINTINLFFENNLNISQTSKKAFMHRNTLIYRLNKIKKITGFNIKNFEEAFELKMIISFINA